MERRVGHQERDPLLWRSLRPGVVEGLAGKVRVLEGEHLSLLGGGVLPSLLDLLHRSRSRFEERGALLGSRRDPAVLHRARAQQRMRPQDLPALVRGRLVQRSWNELAALAESCPQATVPDTAEPLADETGPLPGKLSARAASSSRSVGTRRPRTSAGRILRAHPLLGARAMKHRWISANSPRSAPRSSKRLREPMQKVKEAWENATPSKEKMLRPRAPVLCPQGPSHHAWTQATHRRGSRSWWPTGASMPN